MTISHEDFVITTEAELPTNNRASTIKLHTYHLIQTSTQLSLSFLRTKAVTIVHLQPHILIPPAYRSHTYHTPDANKSDTSPPS
jgi:hypothetical protein